MRAYRNPRTHVQDELFAKTPKPPDHTFGRQTPCSPRLHFQRRWV